MDTNLPIISFRIERLKQSIISQMMISNEELAEILDKEIQNAIELFDFNSVVTKVVHDCLQKELTDYFNFGQGNKIIKNSIQQTFLSQVD